jgi:hypothetical protein
VIDTATSGRSGGDAAQKWASIAVGAAVVFVVSWMTIEASGPPRGAARSRSEADAASTAAAWITTPSAAIVASAPDAATSSDLDAGLALALPGALTIPTGAPKQVKLGVVLVAFAGAEGAPTSARSKREAMAIAERLGQDARSDFHHAVSAGDPGSSDDIGRMPRGVLDPRTEAAVFNLASGEVSDVLETPRGFWIVKRLD